MAYPDPSYDISWPALFDIHASQYHVRRYISHGSGACKLTLSYVVYCDEILVIHKDAIAQHSLTHSIFGLQRKETFLLYTHYFSQFNL